MQKKKKLAILGVVVILVLLGGYSFATRTTVADYKNVTLKKKETKVTQKELDEKIMELRKQHLKTVKRASQKGDVITFSRSVKQKGTDIPDLHSSEEAVTIGEESYAKGFDQHLIGCKAGSKKTFSFTYPKDYPTSAYAGKTVTFSIVVKKVQEIPELTNKFVKENYYQESVSALEKNLKTNMEKQKKEEVKSAYREEAWNYIVKNSKVRKYPNKELELCKNQLESYFKSYAKSQNVSFKEFKKNTFGSEKKYQKTLNQSVKVQAKERLIIEKIAKKEGISYSKKEYNQRVKKLAKSYGYQSTKDFKKKNDDSAIKAYLMKEDILDLVEKTIAYK